MNIRPASNHPLSTCRARRLTLEALEPRCTPVANVVAQTGAANPFASAGSVFTPASALGDLDGDGDLDAVVGMSDGTFAYLRNTGTASAPNFVLQSGAANPFSGIDVGNFADATLGDLDGDGDLDLLAGSTSGTISYFRNTGTAAAPAFAEQTGAANPFTGLDLGTFSSSALGDLDGDGDLDLVGNAENTNLRYFQNTGTSTAPAFAEQTGAANPFAGITGDSYAFPALGDFDGDGKTDLLIGTEFLGAAFYRNTGTVAAPTFTQQTGSANPFNGVNPGSSTQPALGDLDADGDLDTVLGYFSAGTWRLTFYRTNQSPVLTGLSASVTFAENTVNAGAQRLDSGVTISDADGGSFQGGSLTVDNTGTGQEGIGIGTGFGNGITVSGTSFLFNGNTIGTVPASGAGSGLAGNNLVVSFTTAFATPAAVEALIESLTYRNTSDAPAAARTLAVTVNDGAGGTSMASIIVNVTAENDAPAFASTPVTAATEDAAYSYAVTVSDPDAPAQNLTITGTTVPAWLTLTVIGNGTPAASATLTGTPTNADVGDHTVTLTVSDGVASVDQTFTITVANTNDAPTFTSTPVTAATEDAAYSYGVTVADVDPTSQNLTITGTVVPAWLTLNVTGNGTPAASAILTGTPTNADVGDHSVVLTVSDGVTSTQQTFTITVANTNDAPTFTSTPVTAATEDAAYSYGVTVADVDPTSQSLTITGTVVPAWLTLNVTGNGTPAASAILTGTPTNADVGDHTVTLTVSDGVTSVDQTFTITIAAVNDAPSVTVPASITVFEDTPLVLTGISVADPDAGSGNVTLTLAVDAGALSATAGGGVAVGGTPAALTLSGTLTALNTFLAAVGVTYTPGAAAVATLSVTADDGGNTGSGGALQSPAATVGVAVTAVNDAPGFAAGPDQSTTASPAPRAVAGWATGISAGLADEAGQTLAFEVTVDRPELFAVPPAIDPARGALTYTPAPGATGTATVTVRLRDNGGTANGGQDVSAAQTFAITLTPVPPLVAVGGSASGAVSVFNADGTVAFSVPSGGASDPRVATGDVTGDGVADLVVGTGSGGVAGFRVIDGATRATVRTVQAFEAAFTGGVFLAVGDVDGDGFADVAASADATGGGRVTVFGGRDGAVLANFFGIGDPDFRGGARVAFGDVNGDGTPDLVVTAGPGGGPRVAVFDGRTLAPGATPTRLVNDFFALDPALRDGAYVAAGDIDGDGFAEVIVTAGLGGGPRVFAADGRSLVADGSGGLLPRANFFAADPGLRTGARVAAKDIDGDGQADLAVGLTTAAGPVVRLYLGRDVPAGGTPPVYRELTDLGDDLLLGVFVG